MKDVNKKKSGCLYNKFLINYNYYMSSTAAISIGVLAGSFMFVAAFAFIITRIARAKNRERMIKGQAFAYIKSEESRF